MMNIKTKTKRILIIIAVFILITALFSCGNKDNTIDKSAQDIINQAYENMNQVNSMTSTMTIDMGIKIMGLDISMTMEGETESIKDPLASHIKFIYDMEPLGTYNMEVYGVDEDGKYVMYMGSDDGDGNMTWEKEEGEISIEDLNKLSATGMLEASSEIMKDFVEGEKETIDGINTVRYDGKISGDDIGELMKQLVLTEDMINIPDMSEAEEAAEMFKDAGDIPVNIWIDTKNIRPVKYTLDMSEIMTAIMEKVSEEANDSEEVTMSISNFLITVNITGYDNVSSITVPEEAKSAVTESV